MEKIYETEIMHDKCIPVEVLDRESRSLDIQGKCSAATFTGKGIDFKIGISPFYLDWSWILTNKWPLKQLGMQSHTLTLDLWINIFCSFPLKECLQVDIIFHCHFESRVWKKVGTVLHNIKMEIMSFYSLHCPQHLIWYLKNRRHLVEIYWKTKRGDYL